MRIIVACLAIFGLLAAGAIAQAPADRVFSGELTENAPQAIFEVQLEAGQIVTLTTDSTTHLDTILMLTGPNGQVLAENDDRIPGVLTSQLVYVPTIGGRYMAAVSGYNGALGRFTLTLHVGLDIGLSDAAHILREDVIAMGPARAEARFNVELAAQDVLVATAFAQDGMLDSTLMLFDANGAILAENEDPGDGIFNSQIVFQTEIAGRFEIRVGSSGNGSGDLVVTLAVDPDAELPFDFATIEGDVRGWEGGMITDARDSFEFPVIISAGETMLIRGDAVSGDLDLVLRLNGPDGLPVAMNDDRGDGSLNSAIAYTAPAEGSYTLVVGRARGGVSTGEFEINLMAIDAAVSELIQALK